MTESQREQLRAFLREMEIRDERRLDAAGVPYCVVCREDGFGYTTAYGPCEAVQACTIAERLRGELTEEFPEGRWNVWIMRLSPPGDVPMEGRNTQ